MGEGVGILGESPQEIAGNNTEFMYLYSQSHSVTIFNVGSMHLTRRGQDFSPGWRRSSPYTDKQCSICRGGGGEVPTLRFLSLTLTPCTDINSSVRSCLSMVKFAC